MNLKELQLTTKQYNTLLFLVDFGGTVKEAAEELGIVESAIHRLLLRIDKKHPGFRQRLKDIRRVTDKDTNQMPKLLYKGDMNEVMVGDAEAGGQFQPYSVDEISQEECYRPRKSDTFRRKNGRMIHKF